MPIRTPLPILQHPNPGGNTGFGGLPIVQHPGAPSSATGGVLGSVGLPTLMGPNGNGAISGGALGAATPLPILHHPGNPPPVPGQPVQSLPAGTATQPGNVAATAPMPYQTFGGIAQINPSFASPGDQQGYFQQYAQMLQQSMNPYFQQQQQQLEEGLRARGIQDSGAAGQLQGNLLSQQGATLAGQEAPFLSQAFGYTNQDVLSNQNAANEAALYNANSYQQGVNHNYDAYNNYLQQLLGLGASDYGAQQAAYLNSFGPSTGVQSAYGSALNGMQNVYGGVYGNALAAQQQQMQQIGQYAAMSGG